MIVTHQVPRTYIFLLPDKSRDNHALGIKFVQVPTQI